MEVRLELEEDWTQFVAKSARGVDHKTDLSNMILLCQHHHWMVHEGGWRLSLAPDGRVLAIPPETDFYPPEFYPSARAPDEFDVA